MIYGLKVIRSQNIFQGQDLKRNFLLMEHLRQATHFYMLIYMLTHNINVKTLDGFGAGEKYSLVLSPAPNLCTAPALFFFFFHSSGISWASITVYK